MSEVWPEASSTSEEYGISIPCKNEIFSIMKGIDKIVYLNFPYYRIGSTRKRVISSKEMVIKIKKTINKNNKQSDPLSPLHRQPRSEFMIKIIVEKS